MTIDQTSKQVKRSLSDIDSSDLPPYESTRSTTQSTTPNSSATTSSLADRNGRTDSDLMSAAEVLTRLTKSESPYDFSERASTVASPLSSTSLNEMLQQQQQHPIVQLVNAVSRLPLVSNAVRYYELSKRNYASFNYAAEIVEKAAMPVFNKIEINLNSMHQARLEEARLKKKRRVERPKDKKEVKKRLKFCLHILKLANDNISAKVTELQNRIKEKEADKNRLKEEETDGPRLAEGHTVVAANSVAATNDPPPEIMETELPKEAQTEIVATVKKIIHVISNFKPSSLDALEKSPETAQKEAEDVELKSTIRKIIFDLPTHIQQSAVSTAEGGNDRIVVFAKESLDMISKLTSVFNDQLEKAEKWVGGEEKRDNTQNGEKFHSPLNSPEASME